MFDSKRVRGEWFKLESHDVNAILAKKHQASETYEYNVLSGYFANFLQERFEDLRITYLNRYNLKMNRIIRNGRRIIYDRVVTEKKIWEI